MSEQQEKNITEEIINSVETPEIEGQISEPEVLDDTIGVDESYDTTVVDENENNPAPELPLNTSDDTDEEGVHVVDVADLAAVSETSEERIARYKKLAQQQDNQKAIMLLRSLQKAYKRKEIIRGTVSGTVTLGEAEQREVCAVVLYDNEIRILIPYPEFFRGPAYTGNSKEEQNRKKTLLQDMIGVEVRYIITEADFQNGQIIASRAKAQEFFERINFTPDSKTKRRRINVKDFVMARVMAVHSRSIIVEVSGIDVTIRANSLTHKFIENENTLHEMFHVNDMIQVEIDEIRELKDGRYRIRVSRKSLELIDSMIKLEHNAGPDRYERCEAIISNIRPDKRNITMWLKEYKMPAFANSVPSDRYGDSLKVGDKVMVTVVDHLKDGMVVVNIFEKLPK